VDPSRLFDELLGAAARAAVEVRARAFRSKAPFAGGLCTVLGKRMVLLNLNATVLERTVALADALAALSVSDEGMSADARRFLSARSRSRSGVVEPEFAPKPGLAKGHAAFKKKPHQR